MGDLAEGGVVIMSDDNWLRFMIRGNKKTYTYPGGPKKEAPKVPDMDMSRNIVRMPTDSRPDRLREGKKILTGKPEWCMVPMRAMTGVVRVFEAGAKTYGGGSTWLPGIKFSKLFSAICRHLFDWFYRGIDRDEKSWEHPLCHVIANCLMLLTFIDNRRFDDRSINDDYTKKD